MKRYYDDISKGAGKQWLRKVHDRKGWKQLGKAVIQYIVMRSGIM